MMLILILRLVLRHGGKSKIVRRSQSSKLGIMKMTVSLAKSMIKIKIRMDHKWHEIGVIQNIWGKLSKNIKISLNPNLKINKKGI